MRIRHVHLLCDANVTKINKAAKAFPLGGHGCFSVSERLILFSPFHGHISKSEEHGLINLFSK